MVANRWEHFSHDADIGVRGIGDSKARAFEQAALALTAVITDLHRVTPRMQVELRCESPDDELLLYDWLNALVLQMALQQMLFSEFHVEITGHCLHGLARGEPIEVGRHQPAVEVKGATLTALRVCEHPEGTWIAECVVDV